MADQIYTKQQAIGRAKQLAKQFNKVYVIIRTLPGYNAEEQAYAVWAYDSPVFAADFHPTGQRFRQVQAYVLPRGELCTFWSF